MTWVPDDDIQRVSRYQRGAHDMSTADWNVELFIYDLRTHTPQQQMLMLRWARDRQVRALDVHEQHPWLSDSPSLVSPLIRRLSLSRINSEIARRIPQQRV